MDSPRLDFTSSLYLGFKHPSATLEPWAQLTAGAPAALVRPHGAREAAGELAALLGLERAVLGPSTLHIFWDLVRLAARDGAVVYMDSGIYPIGRWGVERAASRGVPVREFRHLDAKSLEREIKKKGDGARRVIVVADGFCPACGKVSPIESYVETVRAHGGCLLLDDTQALGILGAGPSERAPYGRRGGGVLEWTGTTGPDVVVVASLAKAFGAPVAVLAGEDSLLRSFEQDSETRAHCSPPSVAVIRAASRALELNRTRGDALRERLLKLVEYLRGKLDALDLEPSGSLFPVQTLSGRDGLDVVRLHARLGRRGLRAVLHRPRKRGPACLSFLVTASHCAQDLDRAVELLREERHPRRTRAHDLAAITSRRETSRRKRPFG